MIHKVQFLHLMVTGSRYVRLITYMSHERIYYYMKIELRLDPVSKIIFSLSY